MLSDLQTVADRQTGRAPRSREQGSELRVQLGKSLLEGAKPSWVQTMQQTSLHSI